MDVGSVVHLNGTNTTVDDEPPWMDLRRVLHS